jgi:hypothetical protein
MHDVTDVIIRVQPMKRNFDPFRHKIVLGTELGNRVQRLVKGKEGLVERDSNGKIGRSQDEVVFENLVISLSRSNAK